MNILKDKMSNAAMVVTMATGTIPWPLKGGFTVTRISPSGGSAAYIGLVDMVLGDTTAAGIGISISVVEVGIKLAPVHVPLTKWSAVGRSCF